MTIINLIKLIKPIPELYIRKHSIFCFEAFVNGWYHRDEKEDVKANVLYTEFYEWQERNIRLIILWGGLISFIINLKLKRRLWMSSSSYSILFIKKNTKQVYGKG